MIKQITSLNSEQLTLNLQSGDPERVNVALEVLDQAWRSRQFVPLNMPKPDCLASFGDHVPIEVVARYLSVVENYPDFEPTPSGSVRRHALVDAAISYGQGELTEKVALALKIDYYPEYAVSDALSFLSTRGLDGAWEILAAQRLIDQLLDSKSTRQATINSLRLWVMTECFPEVLTAILPVLSHEELAQLALNQ